MFGFHGVFRYCCSLVFQSGVCTLHTNPMFKEQLTESPGHWRWKISTPSRHYLAKWQHTSDPQKKDNSQHKNRAYTGFPHSVVSYILTKWAVTSPLESQNTSITAFPESRGRSPLNSTPLLYSLIYVSRHALNSLRCLPWKWKLQCLLKSWNTFNTWCDLSLKA